ncbi:hypothetical protein [Nannocystis punicea]|uniref:Beta-lactamase n=1 Tax=Nannocystis punicea TaxID=2995304 RepID=A0ABY7GVJ6_9BACT|nr:hypothetical protein [Nannocystis poenicansa]WAS90981.1 hypothetical protein O0S08_32735 [Nannocystis poenicansa]
MIRLSIGLLFVLGCAANAEPPNPVPEPHPAPPTMDCSDVSSCEAACEKGDVPSCVKAGKEMHRAPLEIDVTRLVKVLDRACTGGAADACVELANLHLQAPGLPRDDAKAWRFIQRACELNDPVGCFTLAREEVEKASLRAADGKPANSPAVALALEVARVACMKDDGRACALYGMTVGSFSPSATDGAKWRARGADLLEGSCLRGTRDDCFIAAQQVAGLAGSEQLQRARRLLDRGCELDDLESCLEVAAALPRSQDRDKEAIYRKACAAGSDEGCIIIGKAERDGLVAASDGTKGEALLARGIRLAKARCDLAEDKGCSNLAKALPLGAPGSAACTAGRTGAAGRRWGRGRRRRTSPTRARRALGRCLGASAVGR